MDAIKRPARNAEPEKEPSGEKKSRGESEIVWGGGGGRGGGIKRIPILAA
jgi:hypothetical protein